MPQRLLLAAALLLALTCSATPAQEEKEPQLITRLKTAKVEGPFTLVVMLKAKEGEEKNVVKAAEPCITATRKEKGCLQYDLLEDPENPRQLLLIERWKSVKDLEAHFRTEHLKTLRGELRDKLEGAPKVAFFRKTGKE
jgi:quinol monooxygenase YgiN